MIQIPAHFALPLDRTSCASSGLAVHACFSTTLDFHTQVNDNSRSVLNILVCKLSFVAHLLAKGPNEFRVSG